MYAINVFGDSVEFEELEWRRVSREMRRELEGGKVRRYKTHIKFIKANSINQNPTHQTSTKMMLTIQASCAKFLLRMTSKRCVRREEDEVTRNCWQVCTFNWITFLSLSSKRHNLQTIRRCWTCCFHCCLMLSLKLQNVSSRTLCLTNSHRAWPISTSELFID